MNRLPIFIILVSLVVGTISIFLGNSDENRESRAEGWKRGEVERTSLDKEVSRSPRHTMDDRVIRLREKVGTLKMNSDSREGLDEGGEENLVDSMVLLPDSEIDKALEFFLSENSDDRMRSRIFSDIVSRPEEVRLPSLVRIASQNQAFRPDAMAILERELEVDYGDNWLGWIDHIAQHLDSGSITIETGEGENG